MMRADQHTECDVIKEKTEAMQLASDRLEDISRQLRVCIEPSTGCGDYVAESRQLLTLRCLELIKAAEALASHGKV